VQNHLVACITGHNNKADIKIHKLGSVKIWRRSGNLPQTPAENSHKVAADGLAALPPSLLEIRGFLPVHQADFLPVQSILPVQFRDL